MECHDTYNSQSSSFCDGCLIFQADASRQFNEVNVSREEAIEFTSLKIIFSLLIIINNLVQRLSPVMIPMKNQLHTT